MKRFGSPFSVVLVCGLILAACAPQVPSQAAPPPAQPTSAPPPTEAAAQPTEAAAQPTAALAQPTAAPARDVPGGFPVEKGIFLGDQSTISSLNAARAFAGDRFTLGKFERPYNANTMDTYYPYIDIVSGEFFPDADWVYLRIKLVGTDASGGFPAKYAVEVDLNMDGRGDMLILADHPATKDWSTDGVQVLVDRNKDVGGQNPVFADSSGKGDGYEHSVFGNGQPEVPDAAWVRISPTEANSVELAYKTVLFNGETKYMAGLWAGTDSLNPALFDIDDHFTHEQAGEANPDIANFYPIKEVAQLDNTCRAAIGFTPSGKEPAVCSQGQ